jgi:hypothetical protein
MRGCLSQNTVIRRKIAYMRQQIAESDEDAQGQTVGPTQEHSSQL